MRRLLATLSLGALMIGCGPSNRPTPKDDNSSATQSSNQPTSSFYPNSQNAMAGTGTGIGGGVNCTGPTCQQTVAGTIGEAGQPLALLVNYHYAEDSVSIMVKSTNQPNWAPVQVVPGQQRIPGMCDSNGTAIVDIQFTSRGKNITYTDADEKRVTGLKQGNSFYIGTDDEGDEAFGQKNWEDINDEILQFSCEGGVTFAFRNLVLNPRINLNQWLEGDDENIW